MGRSRPGGRAGLVAVGALAVVAAWLLGVRHWGSPESLARFSATSPVFGLGFIVVVGVPSMVFAGVAVGCLADASRGGRLLGVGLWLFGVVVLMWPTFMLHDGGFCSDPRKACVVTWPARMAGLFVSLGLLAGGAALGEFVLRRRRVGASRCAIAIAPAGSGDDDPRPGRWTPSLVVAVVLILAVFVPPLALGIGHVLEIFGTGETEELEVVAERYAIGEPITCSTDDDSAPCELAATKGDPVTFARLRERILGDPWTLNGKNDAGFFSYHSGKQFPSLLMTVDEAAHTIIFYGPAR